MSPSISHSDLKVQQAKSRLQHQELHALVFAINIFKGSLTSPVDQNNENAGDEATGSSYLSEKMHGFRMFQVKLILHTVYTPGNKYY